MQTPSGTNFVPLFVKVGVYITLVPTMNEFLPSPELLLLFEPLPSQVRK
jgi:hypothetical protein